jgi:chemotaxis protein methyltransferase CheR
VAFTFFFRDRHTLDLLSERLAPIADEAASLRIWDAGCAMGPEPYTLAIILAERLGSGFSRVHIDATDIDESGHFGEIVERGIYAHAEVSRMPEELLARHFQQRSEGDYLISEQIRRQVHYQWHDLLSLKPLSSGYHAVVCKNVLLHFTPEQRVEVLRMFHEVLVPGGFLVTEQTQKMPEACETLFERIASDACLYQRR